MTLFIFIFMSKAILYSNFSITCLTIYKMIKWGSKNSIYIFGILYTIEKNIIYGALGKITKKHSE